MSGFFLGLVDEITATRAAEMLSFTGETRRQVGRVGDVSFAVTRVDSDALWSPARDMKTGVNVLLAGRVAFTEADWSRAGSLPYEGGLAARLLLEAWKQNPKRIHERINGAGVVIILDPSTEELHVLSDRLGVFPLFMSVDNGVFMLCSHPDVLADELQAGGASCEFDETTLAEFLATGTATQPHTYYRQIRQLEPATHYIWRLHPKPALVRQQIFWSPAYLTQSPSEDADAMVEELAAAIRTAVSLRTNPRLGRPLVLLSGGADSRCALFAAQDPKSVCSLTLFDEPNEELAAARRLAELAGAEHHAVQRDPDYYAIHAPEAMRIAGGMWSLVDAHYVGAAAELRAANSGTILTGCYADYMFKGLLLNRSFRKLLGRPLPLYDLAGFAWGFYQPIAPLAASWQAKVNARLDARIPQTLRERYVENSLAIEDLRLRPLAREPDASGRLCLWRTQPWDHLLSDTNILAAYERLSPAMKLNGIVFGKAVGLVIGAAGRSVPNNNYGTPVDASEITRAFWFLTAVLRRKIRRWFGTESTAPRLATSGSWPNWSYYISHSPALKKLWDDPSPAERDLFTSILGRDPWQTPLVAWARTNEMLFLRLVSARTWLRQRMIVQ